jgi:hypothetical protein
MNASLSALSPAAILALSKMLTKTVVNDARDQVDAGDHDVECIVHVRGELHVDEDDMTQQVNKLNPVLLLKLAMDKLNRVSIDSLVEEALEVLEKNKAAAAEEDDDEESGGEQDELKKFKRTTAAAWKRLAKATAQRRRGAVVFDGDVTPAEA